MNKTFLIIMTLVIATALFILPYVHKIILPLNDQYLYGIERANEDELLPSITASVIQGKGNDAITCEGDYNTKVRLRPYTFFMIPQRAVFVCVKVDASGSVEGINRAGYLR